MEEKSMETESLGEEKMVVQITSRAEVNSMDLSNNNNNNNNNVANNNNNEAGVAGPGPARAFGGTRRSQDDGHIGIGGRDVGGAADGGHSSRGEGQTNQTITAIVGNALNQMNLKRSSSAPMINQLGVSGVPETPTVSPISTPVNSDGHTSAGGSGAAGKDPMADVDAGAYASSFLSSLGGPRPRRFSASFSPGSPGPVTNRVIQLRQENSQDWETVSEKEFHGTSNIAQSWEDLSLDSMSMDVSTRRPSISDQLFLSMPTSSAPSSPAASPRVYSRFSPSLSYSSPSPTRRSFTTRRSLSPIAVRPSVLAIGQGVKRKCDWDSNGSNQMDCSPQPAKRAVGAGLLSFNPSGSPVSHLPSSSAGFPFHQQFNNFSSSGGSSSPSPFNHANHSSTTSSNNSLMSMSMITNQHNHVEDSPFSNETESSISSIGACDSPFFRPVDSPLAASVTTSPEDSPRPSHPKI